MSLWSAIESRWMWSKTRTRRPAMASSARSTSRRWVRQPTDGRGHDDNRGNHGIGDDRVDIHRAVGQGFGVEERSLDDDWNGAVGRPLRRKAHEHRGDQAVPKLRAGLDTASEDVGPGPGHHVLVGVIQQFGRTGRSLAHHLVCLEQGPSNRGAPLDRHGGQRRRSGRRPGRGPGRPA